MKKSGFYERAERLGHSVKQLRAGYAVRSTVTVPDVDALRDFMDDGSDAEGRARNESRLCGHAPVSSADDDPSEAALMRRVQAYVYGNAELGDDDRDRIASAFPMQVQAESLANQSYPAGQTVLGTSQGPVTLNYGTVTFANQAYVTIYNTPLTFTCDNIVRTGGPPAAAALLFPDW